MTSSRAHLTASSSSGHHTVTLTNPAALLRLAGAVLVKAHDEWQVSDRYYLSEGSTATLTTATPGEEVLAQPALIPA